MSFLVHDPSNNRNDKSIDPDAFVRDVHTVQVLLVLKFCAHLRAHDFFGT